MELSVWTIFFICLYFTPAVIASVRSHHQSGAILMLNVLLGWTVLGWIAAMVWSCTAVQQPMRRSTERRYWLPPSDDPRSPPHA